MGLNRMMMKNGEVKVEDGSKYWTWSDANNKTISFTVPPGIKRIKVTSLIDGGEGWFYTTSEGEVDDAADIDSIVGVTPNKTYRLLFNCYYTSGVTFSWGKAINDMKPTVEDY